MKLRLPIDIKGTLSDEAIYNVKDIKTLIDTANQSSKPELIQRRIKPPTSRIMRKRRKTGMMLRRNFLK